MCLVAAEGFAMSHNLCAMLLDLGLRDTDHGHTVA